MCAYIDPLCVLKGSCKSRSQGINHELRMSRKAKYINESSRLHLSLVPFVFNKVISFAISKRQLNYLYSSIHRKTIELFHMEEGFLCSYFF